MAWVRSSVTIGDGELCGAFKIVFNMKYGLLRVAHVQKACSPYRLTFTLTLFSLSLSLSLSLYN